MTLKCLLIATIVLLSKSYSAATIATVDSSKVLVYQQGFRFKPGIYLNIQNWKNNNPIPKEDFITPHDPNSPYFFIDLLQEKWLEYQDSDGMIKKVESTKIFGYSVDNLVFTKQHIKITIIGAICHYTDIKYKTADPNFFGGLAWVALDGLTAGNNGVRKKEKFEQYIINFETGERYRFKKRYFKHLIITDVYLYKQYKAFKGSKKEKMYFFLKKYNENHPIYFPVN